MKRVSMFCWPLLLMALLLVTPAAFPEDAKAEVVKQPETFYLVPSSQILQEPHTALPAPITAAPLLEKSAEKPAPAEQGGILGILNNPGVITLLVGVLVGVLKYLEDHKKLESSKWGSLVTSLYMSAEQAGITQKLPGAQKLAYAMSLFERDFPATFGYHPTPEDRADMQNDLAVHAYDDDTTLNARIRGHNAALAPAAMAA